MLTHRPNAAQPRCEKKNIWAEGPNAACAIGYARDTRVPICKRQYFQQASKGIDIGRPLIRLTMKNEKPSCNSRLTWATNEIHHLCPLLRLTSSGTPVKVFIADRNANPFHAVRMVR
jgi:hypothetical protein